MNKIISILKKLLLTILLITTIPFYVGLVIIALPIYLILSIYSSIKYIRLKRYSIGDVDGLMRYIWEIEEIIKK